MTAPAPRDGAVLVGLMSGTSLDGISAAVVRFTEHDGRVHADVLHATQHAYDASARERLLAAMHQGSARDYCRLSADLGDWLGDAALAAMRGAGVSAADVQAVASHGQTLWHEPGHSTWQIGDAARIAERTGCAVINDFRVRDMAVGGQGAPLVPMADRVLFSHPTAWRALQNIGGIGNVTLVPPGGGDDNDIVRAFDTGPGVVIIDGVTQRLFGLPFDRDAAIAGSGRILEKIVIEMLELPYLHDAPPKSTGRELFTPAFIDAFIERCTAAGGAPADIVATACAFTAATIGDQYTRFITESPADVVLSGGGARNPFLVRCIEGAFMWHGERFGRPVPAVRLFDDLFFDAEAKEAVAFALLGYLHLTGRPGNVPTATGARAPRVLGAFTPVAPSLTS
ncbi:MAG TPA: anhydro-N-acetylmuramic acid kinase [Gemmatimonas sp.]|uniref:anhydro-N-acetylmuramic acid kinase n=1 Tax=Gemmatimonas sp. TaxID=1962908 RepID=UPI002ED99BCE